jgi:hypothetical protein
MLENIAKKAGKSNRYTFFWVHWLAHPQPGIRAAERQRHIHSQAVPGAGYLIAAGTSHPSNGHKLTGVFCFHKEVLIILTLVAEDDTFNVVYTRVSEHVA